MTAGQREELAEKLESLGTTLDVDVETPMREALARVVARKGIRDDDEYRIVLERLNDESDSEAQAEDDLESLNEYLSEYETSRKTR